MTTTEYPGSIWLSSLPNFFPWATDPCICLLFASAHDTFFVSGMFIGPALFAFGRSSSTHEHFQDSWLPTINTTKQSKIQTRSRRPQRPHAHFLAKCDGRFDNLCNNIYICITMSAVWLFKHVYKVLPFTIESWVFLSHLQWDCKMSMGSRCPKKTGRPFNIRY